MTLLEKLDKLMEINGLNKRKVSMMADIPYSTIDGLYKKGYKNLRRPTLKKLADCFDVSMEFLSNDELDFAYLKRESNSSGIILTPSGQRIGIAYDKADIPRKKTVEVALEPWLDNGNTSTKKAPSKTEDAEFAKEFHIDIKDIEEKMIEIEVFDQPAAAGFGNYLDEGVQSSDVSLPDSAVPYGTDFGIRISGDSMEPEIADGSIVFVRESLEIEDGEIGIFVLNDDAYCKRLDVDRRRRVVRLVSENDKYGDIVVQEHDTLRTVGRVIGSYLPKK